MPELFLYLGASRLHVRVWVADALAYNIFNHQLSDGSGGRKITIMISWHNHGVADGYAMILESCAEKSQVFTGLSILGLASAKCDITRENDEGTVGIEKKPLAR